MDGQQDLHHLSRRTLMGGAVALGAMGAAFAAPGVAIAQASRAGATGQEGIPDDPIQRAALVRRMRLRHDEGIVMWWFRGRNYAQQGPVLTPICGMVFGAIARISPRADGGLEMQQYELGFRTDLETGERLEKLVNPLTGQTVTVPYAPVGPVSFSYSPQNDLILPETIGGSRFTMTHYPELFWRAGEMVHIQYQTQAHIETEGKADRITNDFGNIYSPATEALDPERTTARAWVQGTDVGDYQRWLEMPPEMGNQTLRSVGAKVFDFDEMPTDWLEMVRKADPRMAANPLSIFDREEATYRN